MPPRSLRHQGWGRGSRADETSFSLIVVRWGWGLNSALDPTDTTPAGESESRLLLLSGDGAAPCSVLQRPRQGNWSL